MSDRFKLLGRECYALNAEGRRVIETSNHGAVLLDPNEEPQRPSFLEFPCPRGQGRCRVRLAGGPADDGMRPKWHWDGNLEQPTLTPSINCLSHNPQNPAERYAGCGWHGYITNGESRDA